MSKLRELWHPLMGMVLFLVFMVRGYLRNEWVAFWGYLLGSLWFLLDATIRAVSTENLRKTLKTVRYVVLSCSIIWAGYVVWKALVLPRM